MAIIETTRPAPFGAVITFRIVNLFDNMRQAIVDAYHVQKTERTLNGLSTAQLDDIGLERAHISEVAKRTRY